jgi:sulfite exporter TauE/SafE
MAASLLLSAVLAGLVGGLHCAAMCGGFITAMSARDAGVARLQPARALVTRQAAYHAGRIASYALVGAIFGFVGSSAAGIANMLPLQQALYVVANLLLLALAIAIAWRSATMSWLARAGMAAFTRALPMLRPLTRGSSVASRIGLGLVWGFVPCTLVYSVVPLALFAGGAWQGATVMLVFGLGTLPHLAGFGFLLARMRGVVGSRVFRRSAAAIVGAFAVAGLYRALLLPATLGQGPFCLVP